MRLEVSVATASGGRAGDRAEVARELQPALPAALPLAVTQGLGAAHCPLLISEECFRGDH